MTRCMLKKFLLLLVVVVVYVFVLFVFTVSVAGASTCRSSKVKHQFDVQQGYPHGRKGYVVDHICALAQGGIDAPTNMQYQTLTDSKAKDKIENTRLGRAIYCTSFNSTPLRQVYNCN